MRRDDNWFTEVLEEEGMAFSLRVREKLHEERTAFQHIEVYETEAWGRLLVIDGCVMLTSRDNFVYHEMMSHPALFTHPDPRRVAIIGGGDCGMLREVLKHPGIESVVQVDIDAGVTRAAERYFPELTEANDDPRATLLFDDGVAWIQDQPAGSLDVVIVDSTDPVGVAEGLFGPGFLGQVYRVLGDQGLMVQQSESPILHRDTILERLHGHMRGSGFAPVVTLPYPVVSYPSGWWSATLASKGPHPAAFRESDARAKAFATLYYNADIHRAALAAPEFCKGLLTDQ